MSTGPLPTFEFRTVPSIQVEWSGAKRLGEMLAAQLTGEAPAHDPHPFRPDRPALAETPAGTTASEPDDRELTQVPA